MFTETLMNLAERIVKEFTDKHLSLATAESCTGGLIGGCITSIAGSSQIFDRGFITYTNRAKHEMLGIPKAFLDMYGAVSEEVARAMAEGALIHSTADRSIAVTGIAGPDGGTPTKPVGVVHIACAIRHMDTYHVCHQFEGNRHTIRLSTIEQALTLLLTK